MRTKELVAVAPATTLSPIMSDTESKSWAVTQHHGKMVSRQESKPTSEAKPKTEAKPRSEAKPKKKLSDTKKPSDGRITLPVLGRLHVGLLQTEFIDKILAGYLKRARTHISNE